MCMIPDHNSKENENPKKESKNSQKIKRYEEISYLQLNLVDSHQEQERSIISKQSPAEAEELWRRLHGPEDFLHLPVKQAKSQLTKILTELWSQRILVLQLTTQKIKFINIFL